MTVKFHIKGTLILNAFVDNASVIRGTVSNSLFDNRSVRIDTLIVTYYGDYQYQIAQFLLPI